VQELIDACRYSDLEEVKKILAAHNIEQEALDRCLYEAAYASLFGALEPLFEAGANPNNLYRLLDTKRGVSQSPLAALVSFGYDADAQALLSAVTLFIEHSANPNLRDDELRGRTPLMLATNHHLLDVSRKLIAAGADPRLVAGKAGRDEDALYKVFTRGDDHECMDMLVRLLLAAGAKPDEPCGSWRRSALMMACSSGATAASRRLIEAGADVNRRDTRAMAAFELAAHKGHAEVCNLLLDHGAEVAPKERLRAEVIASHRAEDWEKLRSLAEAAMQAFATESWVFQTISLAQERCGDLDAAAQCARRGLETAFADILVTRLVISLHKGGQHEEAIDGWMRHQDQLKPGETDRYLLANLLAIYNHLGRRREGLDALELYVVAALQSGSARDGGLLEFNLACLYTLEDELPRALRHVESALASGKHIDALQADPDLAALRAHPAYALVAHKEIAATAWRLNEASTLRETVVRGTEFVERTYQADELETAPKVETQDYDNCTAAALAYVARIEVFRADGWLQCDAPALAHWSQALESTLNAWQARQEAGALAGLGAMVLEWDFGESPGERNLWIAGYGAAPEGTYDAYVYGDGALIEDTNAGPCIDSPQIFEGIVAHLCQTLAFASIRKASSFSFVLQEHDAGHESTVIWRE
jgi:hypothetical protein